MRRSCNVLLPISNFAETSGTFVNVAGDWQSFAGAARPVGESRPGWKVLRVLGNLLELPECEYSSSEEVRDHLRSMLAADVGPGDYQGCFEASRAPAGVTLPELDVPMYQIDSLVRRADALQQTRTAREAAGGQVDAESRDAVNA